MYKKFLLPTDGTSYSEKEIERIDRIIPDDGELIILSVAGRLNSSAFQSRRKVKNLNVRLKKEAEMAVENMAAKFENRSNVKKMVRTGFPAETINQVAAEEDVDLIVIAASGKSGIHKFIIGSVAEKVLKTSEIDVLLLHN
jgi:nucleotide-binding universal stress UspA family protein